MARPFCRRCRCRMLKLDCTNSSIRMFLLNFAIHNANRTSNLRLVALSPIPRFPFIFEKDVNVDGYSSTSRDNSRSLHRAFQNGSHPRQKVMPLPTQNMPLNLFRCRHNLAHPSSHSGGLAGQSFSSDVDTRPGTLAMVAGILFQLARIRFSCLLSFSAGGKKFT
jgi:hypothetical protein